VPTSRPAPSSRRPSRCHPREHIRPALGTPNSTAGNKPLAVSSTSPISTLREAPNHITSATRPRHPRLNGNTHDRRADSARPTPRTSTKSATVWKIGYPAPLTFFGRNLPKPSLRNVYRRRPHYPTDTLKDMLRAKGLIGPYCIRRGGSRRHASGLYENPVGCSLKRNTDGSLSLTGTPFLAGSVVPLKDAVATAGYK